MTSAVCTGAVFTVSPVNVTNGIVPAGTVYTWSAPSLSGGLSGGGAGSNASSITGTINNPGTTAGTATYIVTPSTAACGNGASFTVTVTVNPIAVVNQLSTVLCGGTPFVFSPVNGTDGSIPAGTKYGWPIPSGAGFSGGASLAAQTSIIGTLLNTVNTATTATYTVTPTSGTCNGTPFTVTISINPKAQLIAMTATICNGGSFTTTPTNGGSFIIPSGTTYSWGLPTGTGFTGGASGTNAANISGSLGNASSVAQTAFYSVTPLSGSCTGTGFTITVTVNPVASIVPMTATTCSGVAFSVSPVNGVNGTVPAGTTYSWSLPTGTGFTGGVSGAGAAFISGTLTNTTTAAVTASYTVTPLSGSCSGAAFSVTVTINPAANITAMSAVTCSGVAFNLLPADGVNGLVPPATTYTWPIPTGSGFSGGLSKTAQSNITGTLTNTTNTVQTATYTITPSTGGCTGSVFTVTITLNPVAGISAMSAVICSAGTFNITPVNGTNGIVPAGTNYTWSAPTVTGTLSPGAGGTGTSISGTLTHTNSAAQTATYTITPNTSACGNATTFTVTVIVNPVAAVSQISTAICAGLSFTVTPADVTNGIVPSGTKYAWSLPTGAGFTGGATATNVSTINGTLINTTSSPVTATYTVTPISGSCTGGTFTVAVTLNPKAQITSMTATICSGSSFTSIPADGTNGIVPSGTLYTWGIPTGTAITGGASGTSAVNISGTLGNTSNVARTATYSITPVSGSCTGNTLTLTVTVNPVAAITAITNTICSGVAFTVSPTNVSNGIVPAGTTYSWSAPSTTGNITGGASGSAAAFVSGTLTNTSSVPQSATYIVTPSTASCGAGATFTVTVTVSPMATVNTLSSIICSGTSFNFTPTDGTDGTIPSGTTYQWTVPTGAGITGGISETIATNHIFGTLTNTTNAAATETYTVTPTSGSCTGTVFSVVISVNPKATITAITSTICSGSSFSVTPLNGTNGTVPVGTIYTWSAPTGISISGGLSQAGGVSSIAGTIINTSNVATSATYIVSPTSGSCVGTTFTVTVTVNATASVNPLTATICSGATFTTTPANLTNGIVPSGTTYSWSVPTGSGFTGGLSASGAANISGTLINTTSSAVTVTYLVTPLSSGCTGAVFSVTVTVNPVAAVNAISTTICSAAVFNITPADITNGKVPSGTTYTWSVPTGSGFTGGASATAASSISGTLTNTTNAAVTATYIITPLSGSCTGAAFSLTVTLNPVASVTGISTTVCSGASFSYSPVNGTNGIVPSGTTYSWSTPSTTGGFSGALSGTNATFFNSNLVNTTNTAQTATYLITPNTAACGNAASFTVTVTVSPVAAITDMTTVICGGAGFAVSPINTTNGIVPVGTKYTWSVPTGSGFTGGASQTLAGNINGTLTNNTNTTTTATYTVTPIAGSCTGNAFSVTVTLNPTPYIAAFTATTCSNTAFDATPVNIVNGIVPSGITYTWLTPTGAGFTGGSSQTTATGTITGTLVNTGNVAITATYLITPVSSGCSGAVFSVTLTVNPVASVNNISAITCSGVTLNITPINITNGIIPAGTTYTWSVPTGAGFTGGRSGTAATNISGTLVNTTNTVQTATYLVTPSSLNCGTGNAFTVTVTINPAATINTFSTTICSGNSFNFTPVDGTNGTLPAGTLYTWTTPSGAGIAGGVSQTAVISHIFGTLSNTTNSVQTATYTITPTSGTCTGNTFNAIITVNPVAVINAITSTVFSSSKPGKWQQWHCTRWYNIYLGGTNR